MTNHQTKAITFLPGLMCDQRLWQTTWPLLSSDIQPNPIQFALHDNITDMTTDIPPSPNQQPIDLVGFSMGGYVALHYALNHPGAVKRLVLIASSAWGLTDAEKKRRKYILSSLKIHGYSGITKQRIGEFVHPDHRKSPAVEVIRAMDETLGKDTLIAQLQASTYRPSMAEQLNQLDIPVLIVGAAQDQLAAQEVMLAMGEKIPNCKVEIIEGCGHMIPLEAPEQLARAINDFFVD